MDWPPQSPDCNLIKLLCDKLARNMRKMQPTKTKHCFNNDYFFINNPSKIKI